MGGDPAEVAPFLAREGGVHETCQNYQAKNLYPDFKCAAEGVCVNCEPGSKGCHAMGAPRGTNNFTRYRVAEWGRINSTDYAANARQMVAEIGTRGPISGSICVTAEYAHASRACAHALACMRMRHVHVHALTTQLLHPTPT